MAKYAGYTCVSGRIRMMLRHVGWTEAAQAYVDEVEEIIGQLRAIYDSHRLIGSATLLQCS